MQLNSQNNLSFCWHRLLWSMMTISPVDQVFVLFHLSSPRKICDMNLQGDEKKKTTLKSGSCQTSSSTRFWLDPSQRQVLPCSWGLTGECKGVLHSGVPHLHSVCLWFSRWNTLTHSAAFTLVRILSSDMIQMQKTSSPRSLWWKHFNPGGWHNFFGRDPRLKFDSTGVQPPFWASLFFNLGLQCCWTLWPFSYGNKNKNKTLGAISQLRQESLKFPDKRFQKRTCPAWCVLKLFNRVIVAEWHSARCLIVTQESQCDLQRGRVSNSRITRLI